jgi:hypothetical protein
MLNFKNSLKIYLFKDKNIVDFAIRISDNHVVTYTLPQELFAGIIKHWKDPNGYLFQHNGQGWNIQYKTTTPRPEMIPASYVKISVYVGHIYHYRVSYEDMINLEKEFFYQTHNVMYWDTQHQDK